MKVTTGFVDVVVKDALERIGFELELVRLSAYLLSKLYRKADLMQPTRLVLDYVTVI